MQQQPAVAPWVEALSLSGLSAIPPEYVRPEEERGDLGDAFEQARSLASLIPVVHISAFDSAHSAAACVEAVRAAAAEWGVMHIVGHGIPAELLDRLWGAGMAFFALPIDFKEAYANDPAAGRLQGYGSRLATNTNGKREWEDYLFHLLYPDCLADHALWPAHPPDYVAVARDFGERVHHLASKLLAILSLGLSLPQKTLEQHLQGHITNTPRRPLGHRALGAGHHHCPRGRCPRVPQQWPVTSMLHHGLVNRQTMRVSWVVFCEPPPEAVLLWSLLELVTDEEPARFTPSTFKQHIEREVFKKQQHAEAIAASSVSMVAPAAAAF